MTQATREAFEELLHAYPEHCRAWVTYAQVRVRVVIHPEPCPAVRLWLIWKWHQQNRTPHTPAHMARAHTHTHTHTPPAAPRKTLSKLHTPSPDVHQMEKRHALKTCSSPAERFKQCRVVLQRGLSVNPQSACLTQVSGCSAYSACAPTLPAP